MAEPAMTATHATIVLNNLRQVRDNVSTRAAGLSLMMWGLVFASTAGSLVILNFVILRDDSDWASALWGLFLATNVLVVALWAAIGAMMQNAVWQAFGLRRAKEPSRWKTPAKAFGAAFLLVALNLPLQGLTRSLQGLSGATSLEQELHWNLGFAFALSIGGALVVAITLLMAERGFPKRPGLVTASGMIVFGHLATFLWFPNLGLAAPILAVALLPLIFLGLGSYLFRKG
jgi:hypothetical protein